MTKPLRDLTLLELFALYSRTVWALALCNEDSPTLPTIDAQRLSLEAEVRRRDQQERVANSRLLNAVLVSDPGLNEFVAGIL